ncbi:MAG: hypothetical protein V6Z86_00875 [Hyphomicrobiales bacterium]
MNTKKQLFEVEKSVAPSRSEGKRLNGYRIYNAERKRRTQRNDLPDSYPDLPGKKHDIIYADPPWDYGGKLQFDRSSSCTEKMDWSKNIFISSENFKYSTLNLKQIKKVPIFEIYKENFLLFMCSINPHLANRI